ncbi:MAG TPA: hypothetical protein PLY87_05055 [Planctomycetaceae bacterium]|nr:hypothetical protein [Planctomycetaceae bacterium]HRA89892.1 hypothetical protein [Planctomycetaceae bacterium]
MASDGRDTASQRQKLKENKIVEKLTALKRSLNYLGYPISLHFR